MRGAARIVGGIGLLSSALVCAIVYASDASMSMTALLVGAAGATALEPGGRCVADAPRLSRGCPTK
jgi:hypothetical protein